MPSYLPPIHTNRKIVDGEVDTSESFCLACKEKNTRIRRLIRYNDTSVRTMNTTDVCTNPACWKYIRLPIENWEKVETIPAPPNVAEQ